MSTIIYIMIGVLLLTILTLVGTIIYVKKKKKEGLKKEPDYRAFFYMGIIWFPVGIVFMISMNSAIGVAFLGMGAAYLAIGLAHKDKWKKDQ